MTTLAEGADVAQRRRSRAAAVLGTALITLAIWAIAVPIAGADLSVHSGTSGAAGTVGPAAVVIVTMLAGLACWALLAILERLTARAAPIWAGTSLAVLLVSLLGPLGGVTTGAKLTLLALHAATGAALILLLGRTTSRHR